MNHYLARALTAALTLGLLTVPSYAAVPAVSSPYLADSPFLPDFPRKSPDAPAVITPFVPDQALEVCVPGLGPGERMYVVKAGDTLKQIARNVYGPEGAYRFIFSRNSDRLRDADTIYEGQLLILPVLKAQYIE